MRATRNRVRLVRAWQSLGGGYVPLSLVMKVMGRNTPSRGAVLKCLGRMGAMRIGSGDGLQIYISPSLVASLGMMPRKGDHDAQNDATRKS